MTKNSRSEAGALGRPLFSEGVDEEELSRAQGLTDTDCTQDGQNAGLRETDTPSEQSGGVTPDPSKGGRAVATSPPAGLQPPVASMLALIARAAADPAVDIDKMKALLDMQERLENRQREAEFNAAFARLQSRLPRITKKGYIVYPGNPEAKTPAGRKGARTAYARWEDIMEAILPIVHEEGFALTYDAPPAPDGRISCTATLIHSGGHSRSSTFGPMPLDTSGGKNNLQAAGSTDSYGKRFATRDLLNLVYEDEDDDGVAGGREPISEEQILKLNALIQQTGSSIDGFLKFMVVDSLSDIQQSQYQIGINALTMRKRKTP